MTGVLWNELLEQREGVMDVCRGSDGLLLILRKKEVWWSPPGSKRSLFSSRPTMVHDGNEGERLHVWDEGSSVGCDS